jgi:hypothetical protein
MRELSINKTTLGNREDMTEFKTISRTIDERRSKSAAPSGPSRHEFHAQSEPEKFTTKEQRNQVVVVPSLLCCSEIPLRICRQPFAQACRALASHLHSTMCRAF